MRTDPSELLSSPRGQRRSPDLAHRLVLRLRLDGRDDVRFRRLEVAALPVRDRAPVQGLRARGVQPRRARAVEDGRVVVGRAFDI